MRGLISQASSPKSKRDYVLNMQKALQKKAALCWGGVSIRLLDAPHTLQSDNGSEFTAGITSVLQLLWPE